MIRPISWRINTIVKISGKPWDHRDPIKDFGVGALTETLYRSCMPMLSMDLVSFMLAVAYVLS